MTTTVTIRADQHWNNTGVQLDAGIEYELLARGEWTDWLIRTDADGFSRWYLRPFERRRRAPDQPWFKLMGAVGEDPARLFPIGRGCRIRPEVSGILHCFANDVPSAYGNNKGTLELEIRAQP